MCDLDLVDAGDAVPEEEAPVELSHPALDLLPGGNGRQQPGDDRHSQQEGLRGPAL